MGVGIGGLFTQMTQGDPTQQIANALAGPNPNPQAAAGGAPSPPGAQGAPPGAPGPQAPALPPAQAYSPDPANASVIQQLLKVHQQNLVSNDINQNINRIAAGFGTAQQQHDKMAALGAGGGGDDTLGALEQITKLQGDQFDLQNKQRFQASADLLGQTVFGWDKGQGALLSSNPGLYQLAGQHALSAKDPTALQKDIQAFPALARANGIPEGQIRSTIQMALAGGMMPGMTSDEKNRMQDAATWQRENPGKPLPPELATNAGYAEQGKENSASAIAIGKEKVAAKTGLPDTLKTIKPAEDAIGQMFDADGNLKDSVLQAVHTPDPPSSGPLASLAHMTAGLVYNQDTLDQKANLDQLQNALSASALQGVKNVRNKMEFQAVGGSFSSIFDKRNSDEKIKRDAKALYDRYQLTKYNAIASGGGEIPAEWADKVSKDYLPGGELDNGATIAKGGGGEAAQSSDLRQSSNPSADYAKLPPGPYIDPHGVHRVKK